MNKYRNNRCMIKVQRDFALTDDKNNARLLSTMAIILILFFVAISNSPKSIFAETFAKFYSQANAQAANNRWDKASDLYQKAFKIADDSNRHDVEEKLQLCQLNLAVQNRYVDGSVADQIINLSDADAKLLLQQVNTAVEDRYYRDIDRKESYKSALKQMRIALKSDRVFALYNCDNKDLKELDDELSKLIETIDSSAVIAFENITAKLALLSGKTDKIGLGKCWPQGEFAYAVISSLDKYSYLLSPSQYAAMYQRFGGFYVGLGVELSFGEDWPVVYDVVPGSPAQKSGIKSGDSLIKANNIDLKNKNTSTISSILLGEEDSSIDVVVRRGQNELSFKVKRQLLSSPSVRNAKTITLDPVGSFQLTSNNNSKIAPKAGFLRISSFDRDTAIELRNVMEELSKQNIESLIIDLRNNGGGIMNSAIGASRLFLNDKIIVTVKEKKQSKKYRAGGDNFFYYQLPVVLLVNENTASAAEIFTAALKDNHRAIVIGNQTFGKAVVQSIYQFEKIDSAICITTASYLGPSGFGFDKKGIMPDILVKKPLYNIKTADFVTGLIDLENPVMQTALKYLQKKSILHASNL
ncbi:MAG: S41 family peptidase [Phycisphaerae bacterium]|nr:S41 family peptidase [Phycisphaerae bacterium]